MKYSPIIKKKLFIFSILPNDPIDTLTKLIWRFVVFVWWPLSVLSLLSFKFVGILYFQGLMFYINGIIMLMTKSPTSWGGRRRKEKESSPPLEKQKWRNTFVVSHFSQKSFIAVRQPHLSLRHFQSIKDGKGHWR